MSLILVDGLKDRPGTGGPKFPNGLHLPAGIGITGDGHINMAGVSSFSELSVSGNVTIGGTLTYEDVTNIDVVGVSTFAGRMNVNSTIQANEGINVSAGVGTFAGDVSIADKIIHTGDTNTALRFPSADTITAETAGLESLRVTSTGVGIGTLTSIGPTSLVVARNEASGYIASFRQIHANNSAQIIIDSPTDNNIRPTSIDLAQGGVVKWSIGQAYNASSSQAFHLATSKLMSNDHGAKVTVTTAGRIGIGTVVPARRLHLHDQSSDTVQLHITNSTTGVTGNDGISFALGSDESLIINQRESNHIALKTADTERLRLDSSGRLIVGHNANLSEGCLLQVARTNDNTAELFCYSANANGPRINFTKSRNGTIGSNTIVQDGDTIGQLHFRAADGSGYYRAAAIEAEIDGTPGSSDVPGRLIFSTTADGASTQTERMRLTSAGRLAIGSNQAHATLVSRSADDTKQFAVQNSTSESGSFDNETGIWFKGHQSQDDERYKAAIIHLCTADYGVGDLVFCVDGAADNGNATIASNERLRIDSGGRTTAQGLTLNDNGISGTIFQLNPDDQAPWAFHLQNQTYSTGMEGLKIYQGNDGTNYMQLRADGSYGRFYIQGHDGSASALVLQTLANGDVTTCSPATFDRANAGFTARKSDSVAVTRASGTPLEVNRTGDDGNLVIFYQAGSSEGTISVSGSSVSYNGGVLTRWSQFVGLSTNNTGDRPVGIYTGTVMSNLDEMCEWAGEDNIQLNKTQVSAAGSDRNVAGVFWGWDNDPTEDGYVNDFYIAQTGDYIIRVGAGVTVTKGDLLESAGNGTARPQPDDIIRSKTIAKVSSNVGIMTYADNSYCVPCVLMAC